MVDSHLVVSSSPPLRLSPIAAKAEEKTCLEILREVEIDCTTAEAQAELTQVATQQDYLAGPEEQIRQILLEILNYKPRHKKGDFELRSETFECLYGKEGNNVIPSLTFQPRFVPIPEPIKDHVALPPVERRAPAKPAPAPFASLWCEICNNVHEQFQICVGALSYVYWNIERTQTVIESWQKVVDEARLNDALDAALEAQDMRAEQQLTCARRRYVTVCRMLRKGTISKSAVEEAKQYLMTLLRQEQLEEDSSVLTFVRRQDMNLAMDSCK